MFSWSRGRDGLGKSCICLCYRRPNKTAIVVKSGVNTTVTMIATFTPGVGWVVGAIYYGIDTFYPGEVEGAMDRAAAVEARERTITGHNMLNGVPKF